MNGQFPTDLNPATMIRTSQIIAAALVTGVAIFGVVAAVIGGKAQPRPPMVSYIAILVAAQIVALRVFIPNLIVKSQLKALDTAERGSIPGRLPGLFLTRMIVGYALLEGAAFFNFVAYIIESQWFSLGVAGFMLVLMAAMFPTLNKYEIWTAEVQQSLKSQF